MNKINIFASAAIAAIASVAMLLLPACAEDKASEQTAAINQPTEFVTQAPTESATEEASAQPTETVESDVNMEVLTIGLGTYNESSTVKSSDIRDKIIKQVNEKKVGNKKTIEFAGHKFELVYKQTRTQVVGNFTPDDYMVVKDGMAVEDTSVRLLPDGSIESLLIYPIMTFDIGENTNGYEIRAIIEETLKDEVDFDKFEYCDITEDSGTYYFSWQNKKGGINMDGSVFVSVDSDGACDLIMLKYKVDLGLDAVPDDISLDDYTGAIEAKLKEMYGDTLVDYEINRDSAHLTNINGSPCIDVDVSVRFYLEEGDTEPVTDLVEMAAVIKNS